MASEGYHEDESALSAGLKDRHRAIVSIMEELEAIDWYDQRVEVCSDPELAELLAHNRDEEKEHAAMVLEWLRRRDPKLDHNLRTYLFTDGTKVIDVEKAVEEGGGGSGGGGAGSGEISIGDLRGGSTL